MADSKKTKKPSSSPKVKKGKTKVTGKETKKVAASENAKDVTGNIVVLADQKKANEAKAAKKKAAAKKQISKPLKSVEKEPETFIASKIIMEKTMSKASTVNAKSFDKISNETLSFGKDCSEACAKSGQIFMKGFEDIMGAVVSLMQSSAEKNAKFVKEALSSKTMNEFAEVQSKMAQASFDDFMTGATKISELSVKVLSEGAEPVNSQITKAVQKATESLAA